MMDEKTARRDLAQGNLLDRFTANEIGYREGFLAGLAAGRKEGELKLQALNASLSPLVEALEAIDEEDGDANPNLRHHIRTTLAAYRKGGV